MSGLTDAIELDLRNFGGFLRCETCGQQSQLQHGDISRYLAIGWPKHCGYTMCWWTARQIAAGEVPVLGADTPREDEK